MFYLDNLIFNFIKALLTNSYTQFISLLCGLVITQAIFPEKKKK